MSQGNRNEEWFQDILRLDRFCYRKGFPPIPGTNITSDKGWGCCYRCGQGMVSRFFGKLREKVPEEYERRFGGGHSELFYDVPSADFSIHALVEAAKELGVKPGSWAKPSQMAYIMKNMLNRHGFGCVVSDGGVLSAKERRECAFPCALLLPTFLAQNRKIDMKYMPFLLHALIVENSLGMISGHNSSAYYVVQFSGEKYIYYDPHTTMNAARSEESFTLLEPKFIKYQDLNPSILLGFFCKDEEEMENLIDKLKECSDSPITSLDEDLDAVAELVIDIDDI